MTFWQFMDNHADGAGLLAFMGIGAFVVLLLSVEWNAMTPARIAELRALLSQDMDDYEFASVSRRGLREALDEVERLRKALEVERPHKDHNDLCAENYEEGPCDCTFGAINRRIDAALGAK